jgi:hypothetical protein
VKLVEISQYVLRNIRRIARKPSKINLLCKAFFNTMDWWSISPLDPFLCPTTEEKNDLLKKWPKPGP